MQRAVATETTPSAEESHRSLTVQRTDPQQQQQQPLSAGRCPTPADAKARQAMIFDALAATCSALRAKLGAFCADVEHAATEADLPLASCRALLDGAKAAAAAAADDSDGSASSSSSSASPAELLPPPPGADAGRFEQLRHAMLCVAADTTARVARAADVAQARERFDEAVRLARAVSALNKQLEALPATPRGGAGRAGVPAASPRGMQPSTDRDGESAERRRKRLQQGVSVAHSLSTRTIHTTISLFRQGRTSFQPYDPSGRENFEGSGLASVPGFISEVGSHSLEFPPRPLLLTDPERFNQPYADLFFGREHWNLLATDAKEGPCVASVRIARRTPSAGGSDDILLSALVRTRRGEKTFAFPYLGQVRKPSSTSAASGSPAVCESGLVAESVAKSFRKALPQYSLFSFQLVEDGKLELALKDYEEKNHTTKFKFGVLFAKGDQGTVEDDMYNNETGDGLFEEFLSVLGTKITLAGWAKYRGGLNVTGENATGVHSLYTDWRGFEIMWHVATYLPHVAGAQQQVERKRHLGNDIVVLVFHSGEGVFDPSCFRSQFNHAWIVVRPDLASSKPGEPHYTVTAMMKEELKLYPPQIPRSYSFSKGEYLREFLLTKIMNSELAALKTPTFAQKLGGARKEMLQDICAMFMGSA